MESLRITQNSQVTKTFLALPVCDSCVILGFSSSHHVLIDQFMGILQLVVWALSVPFSSICVTKSVRRCTQVHWQGKWCCYMNQWHDVLGSPLGIEFEMPYSSDFFIPNKEASGSHTHR